MELQHMAGEKILIVDDDKEYLRELTEMLKLAGYDISAVSDGGQAYVKAMRFQPHVILLDLHMKNTDGFQVADRLKNNPRTTSIPIIAMTGVFTKKEDSVLMLMCGIQKWFIKPFNPLEMVWAIEKIVAA
jgi:two-component system cell cycle response regulator